MKLNPLKAAFLFVVAAAFIGASCGEDATKSIGDTDTNNPDGSDNDTASLITGDGTPCGDFQAFIATCDYADFFSSMLNELCEGFDDIFIESFMEALTPCMTEVGCEGFPELILAMEDDAGVDAASIGSCAEEALATAEPGEANLAFQEHLCEYQMECDSDMTEEACIEQFDPETENSLIFFLLIDEPYITQADDCVNPMPTCAEAEAVQECIAEVGEEIGSKFEGIVPVK